MARSRARIIRLLACLLTIVAASAVAAADASARTLTWVRSGDILTLDPHATRDSVTTTLLSQIYEGLVSVDAVGKVRPALAEGWWQTSEPTVWEFQLRIAARFHDGTPVTAADVVFALERARSERSDFQSFFDTVTSIGQRGDYVVRIETAIHDATLPLKLANVAIMPLAWARKEGVAAVTPLFEGSSGMDGANGTGPFRLVEPRGRDGQTVLERNDHWWGWSGPGLTPISRIVHVAIPDPEQRIATLATDKLVFLQDVPPVHMNSLAGKEKLRINIGADTRVLFLGLNVRSDVRPAWEISDANPLADLRVRQAIDMAVDREALRAEVLFGEGLATGVLSPPSTRGYERDLDKITQPDADKARALLAEAGYPTGFATTLHCPSDRLRNVDAVCKKLSEDLRLIGVRAEPILVPQVRLGPLIRAQGLGIYLSDWTVRTFESGDIFRNLIHSNGRWNGTGYSDPEIDNLIGELSKLTVRGTQPAITSEIWRKVTAAHVYLPLVDPTLTYAMSPDIDVAVDVLNSPQIAYAKVREATSADTGNATPTLR